MVHSNAGFHRVENTIRLSCMQYYGRAYYANHAVKLNTIMKVCGSAQASLVRI